MESLGDFILLFITQFAGGPGPTENNLVRFGLAAIFWLVLLIIAWSRQRNQDLPRERLLVVGFGLALARELIMLGLTAGKVTGFLDSESEALYYYPLEHILATTALVVVAGAFLRYALENEEISRRYLQIGISLVVLALLVTFITWPQAAASSPGINFNESWEARGLHALSTLLVAAAILILVTKRDWLPRVVSIALGFFFISEFLSLIGFVLDNAYNHILCPISNAFHIFAIPIFGYVYLKEMSIEKKRAKEKLDNYRDHLEDLVDERTSILVAQNEIADSLSQSIDLETILDVALDKVLPILSMEVGLIFLLEQDQKALTLKSYRGRLSQNDLENCVLEGCPYQKISREAIRQKKVVIQAVTDEFRAQSSHIQRENIQLLYSAPLVSKNQIVGALTLGLNTSDPLNQTNLDLLTTVCSQIGMAVENAHLFREAEVWAEELSMLHEASINLAATLDPEQINREIVIQSTRLTGCPIACVIYSDQTCDKFEVISSIGITPETENLFCNPIDLCGLIDILRTTRHAIVINDGAQDARIPEAWRASLGIRSLICTPVWGVDEPSEFLFLLNVHQQKSCGSKVIELVESFVSRAAVALENAYLHQQLEWAVALEERQRIAANLHDGLAQTISLVGLKVDQTAGLLSNSSDHKIVEALDDIRQTVNQASVEARKSIASLQDELQPRRSLQEILTSFADQHSHDQALTFEVRLSFPAPLYLSSDQVEQVVPILQEAIYNAQRHSEGTHLHILGQQEDNLVHITIEDDGKGFDLDQAEDQNGYHFGLKIMRARAARFGGELQIESTPHQGTMVKLSWSLDGKSNGNRNKGLVSSSLASRSVSGGGSDA